MPDLPGGTVTFLFTDIEGSTRLWEQRPEAMRQALSRHDEIMRSAILQNDGHVFKTMGDSFCASFYTPLSTLHAALAAQQALVCESWPDEAPIKVRMALHTGAVEAHDSDYSGQPLNRVARLLAAGHGGQVLLSLATGELVRDTLPPAASLQTLGEHRLRDLSRPETIFQLLHPDLPAEFPPLKSLDRFPNNLPRQLTSFIGREKEMAEIKSLVMAETQGRSTRYRLLESVRQYGRDRLLDHGGGAEVRGRYRDYFLAFAEDANPKLRGAEQRQWFEALETEHDNLRQALAFCLEDADGVESGLRLAAALTYFWDTRGHYGEGRAHVAAALERDRGQMFPLARARALIGAIDLAWRQGDSAPACALGAESLRIFQELGDRYGIATCLHNLAEIAAFESDTAAARTLYEESLATCRELGDRHGIALNLAEIGSLSSHLGDCGAARCLYEEALAIQRELGNAYQIAWTLQGLGFWRIDRGNLAGLARFWNRAFGCSKQIRIGTDWRARWSVAAGWQWSRGRWSVDLGSMGRPRACARPSGIRFGPVSGMSGMGTGHWRNRC